MGLNVPVSVVIIRSWTLRYILRQYSIRWYHQDTVFNGTVTLKSYFTYVSTYCPNYTCGIWNQLFMLRVNLFNTTRIHFILKNIYRKYVCTKWVRGGVGKLFSKNSLIRPYSIFTRFSSFYVCLSSPPTHPSADLWHCLSSHNRGGYSWCGVIKKAVKKRASHSRPSQISNHTTSRLEQWGGDTWGRNVAMPTNYPPSPSPTRRKFLPHVEEFAGVKIVFYFINFWLSYFIGKKFI